MMLRLPSLPSRDQVKQYGPLAILLCLELSIWVANIEAIVASMAAFSKLSVFAQFSRVSSIVVCGNLYSYWFWGYMDKNGHGGKMFSVLNWLVTVLPHPGPKWVRSVERYALHIYHAALGFDRTSAKKMFLVGIAPVPSVRVISSVYCGLTHWYQGMVMLLLGDLTKTAVEVGALRLILDSVLWSWHQVIHFSV